MYPLVYIVNKIFVITHLRNVLYVIIVCKYVQTLNITFSAHFFRKRQPAGYFAGSKHRPFLIMAAQQDNFFLKPMHDILCVNTFP